MKKLAAMYRQTMRYRQHQAFLEVAAKETGFAPQSVGLGHLPNIGLSSKTDAALYALPRLP